MNSLPNQIPFKGRVEFAKYFIANGCFRRTKVLANYLVENISNIEQDIEIGILSGITATYGKPFYKSQGITKLSLDIIPQEHRTVHKNLMDLRDKLFAHSDTGGVIENYDGYYINLVYTVDVQNSWESAAPLPKKEFLQDVRTLCESLCGVCQLKINQFSNKHMRDYKLPIGRYLLNIRNEFKSDFDIWDR